MKCKSCGGELLFQNGIYLCNSCGATFALDSIYENIDVCICYEENDAAGRRTRDSIIAQEVYRKLEESKVATFYERISADGMTGNDLETGKLAAIHKAKAIIVLGTSVENFTAIETRYSEHFSGKPVIPFCVDVNPGAIPKTLSKIQAMSYSTIGWDKDLIKGVYNILGREQLVDTGSLYGKRKAKFLIIGIIAAVIAVAVGITAWILLKPTDVAQDSNTGVSPTGDLTESTTKPLSQKEIYDKASELLEKGNYVEALELFLQIPDHANSANMLKKIYSQYEGYYQKDGITLHLSISDNIRADIEVTIASDSSTARFVTSTAVTGNLIEGSYQDNLQQTGKIALKLENTGIQFSYNVDGVDKNTELLFEFSEKSDQPINTIGAATIISWVEKQHTLSQILALGYELDQVEIFDRAGANRMYQIKDTDIYLTVFGFMVTEEGYGDTFDDVLVAVQAPAELLMPSYIGKSDAPVLDGELLYWPYGNPGGDGYLSFGYVPSGQTISKSTPIGLTSKAALTTGLWNELMLDIAQISIESEMKSKYKLNSSSVSVVTQNDTHILLSAEITSERCAWYKYDRKSQKATFVKDGPYQAEGYKISKTLWFAEYMDFAKEFPNLFDVTPGSAGWNQVVEDAMLEKAKSLAQASYPGELSGWNPYLIATENNTHILIYVRTQTLKDSYKCAWYKGNKQTGEVTFLRVGPYVEESLQPGSWTSEPLRIAEYLWFKEYSDLAKEFPALYGDPDEVKKSYASGLPYDFEFYSGQYGYAIRTQPSNDADVVGNLNTGYNTLTIVAEQYDAEYNLWGKLESGEGWICLSDIF